MSARNYHQVDITTEVFNASPHRLITLLLNGVLQRVAVAKGLVGKKDQVAEKCHQIGRAQAIVAELQACLDLRQGAEFGHNLFLLYDYIQRRLVEANASNEIAIFDEVTYLVSEIRTAWLSIPAELQQVTREELLASVA